jgi:hypothetical protein
MGYACHRIISVRTVGYANKNAAWWGVIKGGRSPYTDIKAFLHAVFEIPYDIIDTLDISRTLSNLVALGSLDKITEEEFNNLMKLSSEGQYQDLLNQLTELLLGYGARHTYEEQRERRKKRRNQ